MQPCSPYAISKLACYELCLYYRRVYGLDVRQAISFNHESPFRHDVFVTRKITSHIAQGKLLELGNVNVIRDWGHARDYCDAFFKIMQQSKGALHNCYVVSTGQCATVRDFCTHCYEKAGF